MDDSTFYRYRLGHFRVDPASRQLFRADGSVIALTPKVFDTLLLLLRNAGVALSKDAMMAAIWPHRIVEENNLTQNISALRRLFGVSPGDHRYIETVPGAGYRFVAAVEVDSVQAQPAAEAEAPAPLPVDHETAAVPPRPAARRWRRTHLGIGMAMLALALIGAAGWLWQQRHAAAALTPDDSVLAILPFKPLSANARDEVLELGMADTLIAKLSANRHVVVRSLSAVRRFNGADQDPVAAGRLLGVGSVLEGHIQRNGDEVRLNARLLAVPSGRALWSGTFDQKFTAVFSVQDAIVSKVAAALSLQIDRDARHRMSVNYTRNVAAYQLYLDGRYHLQEATPADLLAGIDDFHRAAALDPGYALAYVGLAEAYRREAIISELDPRTVLPLARSAALRALAIDDTLAEAYVPLGFVSFWYDWNWTAAENQFRRGIELQPNYADAHFGYAALLSNLGRSDEALRESQRARELDPLSPLYVSLEASFVANAGHPEQARQQIDDVLRAHPAFWIAKLTRGWMETNVARFAAAVTDFTRASALSGANSQALSMQGFALARAGRANEAHGLLDVLLARAHQQYVPPTSVATIDVGLGDKEQALAWLQRGFDARDVRMTFLKVDHRWDTLRADPRFVSIMRRMQLP